MDYIVERISDRFVILELDDCSHIHVPTEKCPPSVREGDILTRTDTGYEKNEQKTEERRHAMAQRMQALFRKHP